jgi:Xaa-Pro aminopeptidase
MLETLGREGRRVRLDSATASVALLRRIEEAGGTVDAGPDPISLMKAVKNEAEIAGSRAAHLRDGAAVARFLAWFDREAPAGSLMEIDAVEALEGFRVETGALKDVSFPSISGAGPNAALPHYRVTRSTNRRIERDQIFLIDSGAQYEDGTTDITRTVIVGEPSAEMKDRYTRVLKGHIAIARAVFPKGTNGAQLDSFARQALWEIGTDFDHGTGHGIGSYLSVHEGPQRIAKTGHTPLEPGMMLSNEPGYYKAGAYGIRIENLILVERRAIPGAEREIYGFETLTFAPIDTRLVEPSLMTPAEIAWLDAYHAEVRAKIAGLLDPKTQAWLETATRPLG